MSLVKNIQEIKLLLPRLLSGLNEDSLLPNFDRAEIKHLLPFIGSELLDLMSAKYNGLNTEPFTPKEARLLPQLQLVLTSGAFLDELGLAHATITDNGIRTAATANAPRVFGWEYDKLEAALKNSLYESLDGLIAFLFSNAQHFPTWTGSEAFKQFDTLLIKTAVTFNGMITLSQPFKTFYSLRPIIYDVQEQYIVPVIGRELFTRFKDATDLTAKEWAIKEKLQKALAFLTIKKACEHFAVQFDENGFTIVASQGSPDSAAGDRTGAVGPFLALKMEACNRDGNNWLARAKFDIFQNSTANDVVAGFTVAYNASPLVTYVEPSKRDSGNSRRKIFRF